MIADKFFPDLTMIASCTNPVVFIIMSPPLQRRLKSFLDWVKNYCCCCLCYFSVLIQASCENQEKQPLNVELERREQLNRRNFPNDFDASLLNLHDRKQTQEYLELASCAPSKSLTDLQITELSLKRGSDDGFIRPHEVSFMRRIPLKMEKSLL